MNADTQPAGVAAMSAAEGKLEGFAEDLGKLLGQAQNKAESWLGQRTAIAEQLLGLRDTATRLLEQLGVESSAPVVRRGRPAGTPATKRGPGRPKGSGVKKKRIMSAEARERIAAAQRARWAKQKKAAGKS
jgi:hypothetical protein